MEEIQNQKKTARRRRPGQAMPIILCLMTVLCAAVIALFGFFLPWRDAETAMPDGLLTLREQEDGSALLSWPAAEDADLYRVEVLYGSKVIDTSEVAGKCFLYLEDLPRDRELTIRVSPGKYYRAMLQDQVRIGAQGLEATDVFAAPEAQADYSVLPQSQSLRFYLGETGGAAVSVQLLLDGAWEDILSLTESGTELSFGEDGLLALPEAGEVYEFQVRACRTGDSYIHYGCGELKLSVSRDSLLGTQLGLSCTESGGNRYLLRWNETRGEYFEVQCIRPGSSEWVTVKKVSAGEACSYDTGALERYSEYRFRIVACGQPQDSEEIRPEEVTLTTGATVVYSTIWPLKDLEVYADTGRSEVLGTAPAARAYCVLEEAEGLFKIRFGSGCGYIDSSYCMINLPEYMGDLCGYDIHNSYDSLIMVHDYYIPGITGTTIKGYENVMTSQGDFLVPLLYPVAQRLEQAALAARDQGYRLKIYDSFRPGKATRYMYDTTAKVLDDTLPEYPYNWDPADGDTGVGGTMTYEELMTGDGRYKLSYFMAKNGSRHNQGVALDLTLEDLETGEELPMQTNFNDLSWYSEVSLNNKNANTLSSIMKGAGFAGLVSEWWHFQDDEIRNTLGIDFYLAESISAECWVADGEGWRYRMADGSWYTDTTAVIDGVEYVFDKAGYASARTE